MVKFNLNKALIGIDSIENNSKKIELKDDVIKLTTGNDKTVSIKDNILSGVNKVGIDKVNISFEVESDKNGSKTPSKAKINIDDKSVDFAVSTKDE